MARLLARRFFSLPGRAVWGAALLALGLLASSPAHAGKGDDDLGEEDEKDKDEKDTKRNDSDDSSGADPENDENWAITPDKDESEIRFDDEDGEDVAVKTQGPGEDTAKIYRAYLEKVKDLTPDEEALAWERYLKKYPKSTFKSRIEQRLEELGSQIYDEHIEDTVAKNTDAGRAEIKFSQPSSLEAIDPRSRIRAGFEFGRPDYATLITDLEYQLQREWSVHGGVRGRYTGPNLEMGTHYAIIKSARQQMLLTAIGDVHFNLNPFYPGFRPQLAFGKRFKVNEEFYIDAQVQGGVDLIMRKANDGTTMSEAVTIGGANITVAPNNTVRAFMETNVTMKNLGAPEEIGSFRFNTLVFGLRFVQRKSSTKDRYEVAVGAQSPYSANYWGYHFGAVGVEGNFYYGEGQ